MNNGLIVLFFLSWIRTSYCGCVCRTACRGCGKPVDGSACEIDNDCYVSPTTISTSTSMSASTGIIGTSSSSRETTTIDQITTCTLEQTTIKQIIGQRESETKVQIARIANETSDQIAKLTIAYRTKDAIGKGATIIAAIFMGSIFILVILNDLMSYAMQIKKASVVKTKKKPQKLIITKPVYYNFPPQSCSSKFNP